jgi:hypothetical protein
MYEAALIVCGFISIQGSAEHSSPVRIYSYAASGPPCGLPEREEVDTIGQLHGRPRLGPQYRPEEL